MAHNMALGIIEKANCSSVNASLACGYFPFTMAENNTAEAVAVSPVGFCKPTISNGMIVPFADSNAESKVRHARAKLNKLETSLREGNHMTDGVSTSSKILEAKAELVELLESNGIVLTEDGLTACLDMASKGFHPTGNAREGYDLVLTPEQSEALTEKLKEHDDFIRTDEGQEYSSKLVDQHRAKGGFTKVRHSLNLKDGIRFKSTFTMESELNEDAHRLLTRS